MQSHCILDGKMYLKRTLENFVRKINNQFPVLLIAGPRQVGKTTFLKHISEQRTYVTLDDPILAELAKTEPKLFLEKFAPPVLIDEIQYAPELLPYIKMHIDKQKSPGDFWLTGSQQFHLMRGVSESLAGRVAVINMLGLSQSELEKYYKAEPFIPTDTQINLRVKNMRTTNLHGLYTKIWRGSYPAIALDDKIDMQTFYGSYIQTYLQRDLRDLTKVGDENRFLRFLRTTAARTGQQLNITDVARDSDISVNTAKNWLSILETSGLIFLLQPYANNLTKRMVKTPKLYFLDTGLCSYLTQWTSATTLEAGAMSGAMLETFIIGEILKSYWHNGKQPFMYYYRDKDQQEIDVVLEQDQTLFPIEIKKTASPRKSQIKQFSVLKKFKKDVGSGALICLVNETIPITETVQAVPASII